MGPNLYRLEESAVLGEAYYHDVIETELQTDGTVRYLRVQTPSGLTSLTFVVSQPVIESPAMSALLERVVAVGGNWEKIFGGVLILHLPPQERYPIVSALNSLMSKPPAAV
jgi:hypothetical protein